MFVSNNDPKTLTTCSSVLRLKSQLALKVNKLYVSRNIRLYPEEQYSSIIALRSLNIITDKAIKWKTSIAS